MFVEWRDGEAMSLARRAIEYLKKRKHSRFCSERCFLVMRDDFIDVYLNTIIDMIDIFFAHIIIATSADNK